MPLPPVLAAKLSKRGLLTSLGKSKVEKEKKRLYKGTSGCPNKYNVYHDCNVWCEVHWNGVLNPNPKYLQAMQKLLLKYPLPHNWMEIFDKGTGRYYFWDMETDLVSWLPPKHPKAVHIESAAKLRERRFNKSDADDERVIFKNDSKKSYSETDKKDGKDERHHKFDGKDKNRKRSRKDDIIDPMDPAAYSDIPQGTWSDGLENNKSKADSTASGSLYQQRPYPAPGEVLNSNKKQKNKKNVNFSSISYA